MAWEQLELEKAHIAYACVGIFSTIFSLLSLFVKERLYIGEATVATIAGLILGPHCLGWFDPVSWGNSDKITLEICRIVLCIQIVAVAVELPRKYMKKHWVSVTIFLGPVMTCGWLVVGLFIWCLIPHFDFPAALLVSACVTATDPVLAAAVVGKGKFAERVPGHLRNLLSAESGCNDGMAFPFIYLSLGLVLYPGDAREIVKDWFTLTIFYECIFGCLLGTTIGYVLRKAVAFAENKNLIDRESFLAIFIFLAFNSAGIGSMLGVDDLLVSFAAGTAFGWNGDFAKKTEESHVSTVIDLLLNLAFFVYFGAIVPWPQFNDGSLGLDIWRLIVLAIVIIFLRRLPAVVALKPITPDVKTWREAFFCGHFGPIGVGALFAAILARKELESHYTEEETPLAKIPTHDFPHTQLIAALWPTICFIVITSIVVHGSSVAVLTLGKRLNRMAITMSFTTTNTTDQGANWMSRLQKLDKVSTSFSLHRVDTQAPPGDDEKLPQSNTVETSGIKVRPAGGAKRRKNKKKKRSSRIKKTLSRATSNDQHELRLNPTTERQRPQAEFLQLGKTPSRIVKDEESSTDSPTTVGGVNTTKEESSSSSQSIEVNKKDDDKLELTIPHESANDAGEQNRIETPKHKDSSPVVAYQEGDKIIIEDQHGEIFETVDVKQGHGKKQIVGHTHNHDDDDNLSVHSMGSLRRQLTEYSSLSSDNESIDSQEGTKGNNTIADRLENGSRRAFYKKSDPKHHKVYAHQVDNLIVIENEDGEVIRRYKVNPHAKRPQTRSRSGTIVGRALSLVGIKKEGETEQTSVPKINVTGADNILVPEYDSQHPNSPLKDPALENKIENKLTSIIMSNKSTNKSGRRPSLVPEESGTSEFDSEETSEEDEDEEDEDELHETEVEKRRRLAALGQIPTSRRDEEDEEEE